MDRHFSEFYVKERERLLNELEALEENIMKEAPIHVGDIVVDENGNEYLVRTVRISWFFKTVDIDLLSKKKKNGEWSGQVFDRRIIHGGLKLKKNNGEG